MNWLMTMRINALRKLFAIMLIAFAVISALLFAACGQDVQHSTDVVRVMVEETFGVEVKDNFKLINSGEDVTFHIVTDEGFAVVGTDYPGKQNIEQSDGKCVITLNDVLYPVSISLDVTGKYCTIEYDANGGISKDGKEADYLGKYSLENHLRPNTETDIFYREGYTLIGWNTAPDGSGQSIGLGSRVTVEGEKLKLYAIWARFSNSKYFEYSNANGYIRIEGYCGNEPRIVIPAEIDGLPVKVIGDGSFVGCSAETVVVPDTVLYIQEKAFVNCNLRELYIFDNLIGIYEESFINCSNFSTVHINAKQAPSGYNVRRESMYADKADLLILATGKRKMVFWGGCGIWYNLDGDVMDDAFDGEFEIINMGLNGAVNGVVQAEVMLALMEEGDVLVHVPEENSAYQLITNRTFTQNDEKLWCGMEMNYDLFSLVDIRCCPGALQSFCAYFNNKSGQCSYGDVYYDRDGNSYIDEYGCIPFERIESKMPLSDPADISSEIFPGSGSPLAETYSEFVRKGIEVYVTYAAVNGDAIPSIHSNMDNYAEYEKAFCNYAEYKGYAKVISSLAGQILKTDKFYDSNYHLLSDASSEYTRLLAEDLLLNMNG